MKSTNIQGSRSGDLRNQIYLDQLALMYQALPVAATANMVLACLLSYVVFGLVDSVWLMLWLGISLVWGFGRLFLALAFKRYNQLFSASTWEKIQLVAITGSALIWSWAILWMFPILSPMEQALVVVLLTGLHLGVVLSTFTRPMSAVLFVGITMLAMLFELLNNPEPISNSVAIMYVMYLAMLILSTHRSYKHNLQSLTANYEAQMKDVMLEGSEERFRAIVNSAGEMLIVHDQSGRIRDLNPLTESVLGFSRAELVGNHIVELMPSLDHVSGQHVPAVSGDEVVTYETIFNAADGEQIPVDVCINRYSDPDCGQAFLLLARDLRAKKAEEQELRFSRQKLGLHVRSTPLAVIEWDSELRVVNWNPAAEKIFGYRKREALGKKCIELLVPNENRAAVAKVWEELIQNRSGGSSTSKNLTKDGRHIYCEWYHTTLVDDDGQVLGMASLAMDITQRVQAERALKEAKKEAEKASRAKSEFLSKMSHELRTPLNAIIGFSDLMGADSTLCDVQQDYMQEIRKAGEHLLALVNDVLDLSRIEHGKLALELKPIRVSELLETAVTMIRPLAFERHIEIGELPSCNGIEVLSDQRRLTQIIINLLSNAVKYNRENGRIDIRCDVDEQEKLVISISDTGVGIADAERDKVFTPFERVGDKYNGIEGTGIGLMISRGLVENMGGSLTFESCEGIGSSFALSIPLHKKNNEPKGLKKNIA